MIFAPHCVFGSSSLLLPLLLYLDLFPDIGRVLRWRGESLRIRFCVSSAVIRHLTVLDCAQIVLVPCANERVSHF